ncbi:MAG: hypothetical protein NTV82_03610, partial [Candidatus Aminicenantes bacterium]|nr:hypothetical protein [Candidatus Aminicenantes bacterium]
MKKVVGVCFLALLLAAQAAPAFTGVLPFDTSEYAARRARLMAQIPDGVAVIWGSVAGPQNNEFTYFCGVKVP